MADSIRLPDALLERSDVVANSRMNRERLLRGRGGYEAELRFGIVEFLTERLEQGRDVAWLDLCCGTGRALVEAAGLLAAAGLERRLRIAAVDLVRHDLAIPSDDRAIEFHEASLPAWKPAEAFDLITCVHGLHYLGDKLRVIASAASWLKSDGVFQAHLDPSNLRHARHKRFGPMVRRWLEEAGFTWHPRFHRLSAVGPRSLVVPWSYLGADDKAGPNFTGQPAVDSWYGERDTAPSL